MKLTHIKNHDFRAVLEQEFCLKYCGLPVGFKNSTKITLKVGPDGVRIGRTQHIEVRQI